MNKNNNKTLYLDMDGVLVDLTDGIFKKNRNLDKSKLIRTHGEKEYYNKVREFLSTVDVDFWVNLNWIKGGKELIHTAFSKFNRVCILSSSGTSDRNKATPVIEGKRLWVAKNIPSIDPEEVFIVYGRRLKPMYANPSSILVDDMNDTIQNWNFHKGIGILHNHLDYKNTIYKLEEISHFKDSLTQV